MGEPREMLERMAEVMLFTKGSNHRKIQAALRVIVEITKTPNNTRWQHAKVCGGKVLAIAKLEI